MTAPARVAPQHRFVEHGGEVEVELTAKDERGILDAAVAAFAELVTGDEKGERLEFELELTARDRALLLVDLLNELLFLAEVEQFVPAHIRSVDLEDERMRATIAGRRGTPRPLVKGVALGGLRYEQEGGLWHGRVVFDV